jgi:hypothetical protein
VNALIIIAHTGRRDLFHPIAEAGLPGTATFVVLSHVGTQAALKSRQQMTGTATKLQDASAFRNDIFLRYRRSSRWKKADRSSQLAQPSFGGGTYLSYEMIAQARKTHPDFTFYVGDIEDGSFIRCTADDSTSVPGPQ